jgi:hypothetical protein
MPRYEGKLKTGACVFFDYQFIGLFIARFGLLEFYSLLVVTFN